MIDHSVCLINKRQINSRDELHFRSSIGVVGSASDFEAVNTVLVHSLMSYQHRTSILKLAVLTCPGPMIVPFQLLMRISSPSSNPYEHEPSPIPFSPFSSSSRRRKFLGTARQISYALQLCEEKCCTLGHCDAKIMVFVKGVDSKRESMMPTQAK